MLNKHLKWKLLPVYCIPKHRSHSHPLSRTGILFHLALWLDWDKNFALHGKKNQTNDVSNDNSGLNDDALRIR